MFFIICVADMIGFTLGFIGNRYSRRGLLILILALASLVNFIVAIITVDEKTNTSSITSAITMFLAFFGKILVSLSFYFSKLNFMDLFNLVLLNINFYCYNFKFIFTLRCFIQQVFETLSFHLCHVQGGLAHSWLHRLIYYDYGYGLRCRIIFLEVSHYLHA